MLLEAIPTQIACWANQENTPNGPAMLSVAEFLSFSYIIPDLDFRALDKSYDELIKRHEALRTTFFSRENIIWQSINRYKRQFYELEVFDVVNCCEQDQVIKGKTSGAIEVISNLKKGPLIKALLFKVKHGQHLFICVLNHIISDDQSIRIIKENLSALYKHYKHGHSSPAATGLSIENIVMKQRLHTKGIYADKEKEYWLTKLSTHLSLINFEPFLRVYSSNLKTKEMTDGELDQLNPNLFLSHSSSRGSQIYFTDMPFMLLNRLRTMSKTFAVSVFAFHLAAFELCFCFFNDERVSLFGTSINDRRLSSEKNLVGHLTYKIYLGQSVDDDLSVGNFVRKVYMEFIQSCKHPIYNESEYDHLHLDSYTSIYLNYLKMTDRRAVYTQRNIHAGASNAYYALSCDIEEYENSIGLYWHYNRDIFTPGAIEFMAEKYQNILSRFEDMNITVANLRSKCKEDNFQFHDAR
jgi:hypothetical protein